MLAAVVPVRRPARRLELAAVVLRVGPHAEGGRHGAGRVQRLPGLVLVPDAW